MQRFGIIQLKQKFISGCFRFQAGLCVFFLPGYSPPWQLRWQICRTTFDRRESGSRRWPATRALLRPPKRVVPQKNHQPLGDLLYTGDEILPSYIGKIITGQCKDPYKPTQYNVLLGGSGPMTCKWSIGPWLGTSSLKDRVWRMVFIPLNEPRILNGGSSSKYPSWKERIVSWIIFSVELKNMFFIFFLS